MVGLIGSIAMTNITPEAILAQMTVGKCYQYHNLARHYRVSSISMRQTLMLLVQAGRLQETRQNGQIAFCLPDSGSQPIYLPTKPMRTDMWKRAKERCAEVRVIQSKFNGDDK